MPPKEDSKLDAIKAPAFPESPDQMTQTPYSTYLSPPLASHMSGQSREEAEISNTLQANFVPPSSKIVLGAEYLRLPRAPQTWLVEPLLPTGGSLLLYGDAKTGKSFAGLQLACAIAESRSYTEHTPSEPPFCQTLPTPDKMAPYLQEQAAIYRAQLGKEWLGFRIPNPGRVVYIQLDTPRSIWADRVEKLRAAGMPIDSLYLADRETLDTWPFDILNPAHLDLLRESLSPLNPSCVFIDTIREAHSGDENDSTVMRNVIACLTAAVNPAALVLVAHSRKPSAEGGYDLMADNRGSNYIVGRMDGIVRFTKRGIRATSRAMEEVSIDLDRLADGTWRLSQAGVNRQLALDLLAQGLTQREASRQLARQTGLSEEASRSAIRRAAGSHDDAQI